MKKRTLAVMLALATIISGNFVVEVHADEKETLEIWDTFVDGSLGKAQEEIISSFQEANPDIEVIRVPKEQSTLEETLKAAFMAGDAPDVIYLEAGIGSVGNYVKAGYYEDLTNAYDEYGWKNNLMSACWEIPSADNFIWGVGNEMETMSLYVNQDIFDELGLEQPKTIEELTEDMKVIKDAGYNVLANTLDSEWYNNMNFIGTILYSYMSQDEIENVMNQDGSWDKESVRAAVECIADWLDKGYFPSHPEVDGDQEQLYFAGDTALWITGNWEVGNTTEKTDFTTSIYPFPGSETCSDGGSQVNFAGGAYLVYSGSESKEAAYKFIEWWNKADKDGKSPALEWSLENGFPAYTYSVQDNEEYKANKKLSAMSAANPEAPTDFIVDSNFPGISSVLTDVIPEMINSVAFGKSSVDEALEKAQNSADKIVEKYNK